MKLTTKQLKQMIKEELSGVLYEEEDLTQQLGEMLSNNAEEIIMGLEMAYSMGLTPENIPFEKLDLSKQNIPNYNNLLKVAEVVLDTYGDYIDSALRKLLVKAMELGLRRRLDLGHKTGMEGSADRIRKIIKNELTGYGRGYGVPINVIEGQ